MPLVRNLKSAPGQQYPNTLRPQFVFVTVAFLCLAGPSAAQQGSSHLRQIEKEMLARIAVRASENAGFRLGASDFDVRIPLEGEPHEIFGATLHAAGSLAVGSARVEPLDTIPSRDSTFLRARYDLRLEDRRGNCLIVHQHVTYDSVMVTGARTAERCQPLYMAEVVRRNRRIVRLPLSAGRLDDRWSAALAATGTADVYLDSLVITTSSIVVRAAFPVPASAPVTIDSISAGLAAGERSWSIVRRSAAIRVDTTMNQGGEWRRGTRRFVIPVDGFDLAKSWPAFEVYLSVPVTADNPGGIAWTYAHERKAFFHLPAISR